MNRRIGTIMKIIVALSVSLIGLSFVSTGTIYVAEQGALAGPGNDTMVDILLAM